MKKILLFSLLFTQLTIHANQMTNPHFKNVKEELAYLMALPERQLKAFTTKQNSLVQSIHTETNIPVNKIINLTFSDFENLSSPHISHGMYVAQATIIGERYVTLSRDLTKQLVAYIKENHIIPKKTGYIFPTLHANLLKKEEPERKQQELAFELALTEKQNSLILSLHTATNIPFNKFINFTFNNFANIEQPQALVNGLVLTPNLTKQLVAYIKELVQSKPIYEALGNTENYFDHAILNTDYMFPILHANPQSVSALELTLKKKKLAFTNKQNLLVQSLHTATNIPVNKIINLTFNDFENLSSPQARIKGASGELSMDITKLLTAHINEIVQSKPVYLTQTKLSYRNPDNTIALFQRYIPNTDYIFPTLHTTQQMDPKDLSQFPTIIQGPPFSQRSRKDLKGIDNFPNLLKGIQSLSEAAKTELNTMITTILNDPQYSTAKTFFESAEEQNLKSQLIFIFEGLLSSVNIFQDTFSKNTKLTPNSYKQIYCYTRSNQPYQPNKPFPFTSYNDTLKNKFSSDEWSLLKKNGSFDKYCNFFGFSKTVTMFKNIQIFSPELIIPHIVYYVMYGDFSKQITALLKPINLNETAQNIINIIQNIIKNSFVPTTNQKYLAFGLNSNITQWETVKECSKCDKAQAVTTDIKNEIKIALTKLIETINNSTNQIANWKTASSVTYFPTKFSDTTKFPKKIQLTLPVSQLALGIYSPEKSYWNPVTQVFYFLQKRLGSPDALLSINYPEENFDKLTGVGVNVVISPSNMWDQKYIPKLVYNTYYQDEKAFHPNEYGGYYLIPEYSYSYWNRHSQGGGTIMADEPISSEALKLRAEIIKETRQKSQKDIETIIHPFIPHLNAFAKLANILEDNSDSARRILLYAFQGILSCFHSITHNYTDLINKYKVIIKPLIKASGYYHAIQSDHDKGKIQPTDSQKDLFMNGLFENNGIIVNQQEIIAQTVYFILYGAFPKQLNQALSILGLNQTVFEPIMKVLTQTISKYFVFNKVWEMQTYCAGCITPEELTTKLLQALQDTINILIKGLNGELQNVKTLSEM